jgi:hypothetical protein
MLYTCYHHPGNIRSLFPGAIAGRRKTALPGSSGADLGRAQLKVSRGTGLKVAYGQVRGVGRLPSLSVSSQSVC